MQIDIRSNVRQVSAWLDEAQRQQLPFATALAMTRTAQDVKSEEISVMKRVFDRPTNYTLNSLFVRPATKRDLIASVEFKEFAGKGTPAKRFLNPHVHGGGRSHKRSERLLMSSGLSSFGGFTVLGRSAPRDSHGNMTGGQYTKLLSQVRASGDATSNASGSRRSKAKRKTGGHFIAEHGNRLKPGVYQREGQNVKPILIFTKAPVYRKRFPFYETASTVVAARFDDNFKAAFQFAMGTAKTPK